MQDLVIRKQNNCTAGLFNAMASRCEVLVDTLDEHHARTLADIAMKEALRIEEKFSRYRKDNIIYRINHSAGKPVETDEETANLLDYAEQCYNISDGLFDVTSGVLRKIWTFDGSDNVPEQRQIDEVLQFVGWNKVIWNRPKFILPRNMEIDFGGIGKEYAVDQAAALITNTVRILHLGLLQALNFPKAQSPQVVIRADIY